MLAKKIVLLAAASVLSLGGAQTASAGGVDWRIGTRFPVGDGQIRVSVGGGHRGDSIRIVYHDRGRRHVHRCDRRCGHHARGHRCDRRCAHWHADRRGPQWRGHRCDRGCDHWERGRRGHPRDGWDRGRRGHDRGPRWRDRRGGRGYDRCDAPPRDRHDRGGRRGRGDRRR